MKATIRTKMINIMIDEVIRRFGFEHKNTIYFCTIAEKASNIDLIKKVFHKLMS